MQDQNSEIGWKYSGKDKDVTASNNGASQPKAVSEISWTASEYIEHQKGAGWFIRFSAISFVAIGFIFFITRDYITIVILAVLAIVFGFFAARKPAVLAYRLDNRGVTIGQKFYPVNLFRSFAVIEEDAFRTITLLPMKRFMPSISLHYPPEEEKAILETFGNLLPRETRQQDPIDKFMHRIRF